MQQKLYLIVSWQKGSSIVFEDRGTCVTEVYRVDLKNDGKYVSPVYGERTYKSFSENNSCSSQPTEKLRLASQDEYHKLVMAEENKRQWMPQRLYLALFLVAVWTVLVCYRRRFSIRYVSPAKGSNAIVMSGV
jgi:hypothetical protein